MYLSVTVWIDRVVGKSDLVAFSGGVHDKVIVQVEQEAAHISIVQLASPVSLILITKTLHQYTNTSLHQCTTTPIRHHINPSIVITSYFEQF